MLPQPWSEPSSAVIVLPKSDAVNAVTWLATPSSMVAW